MRAPCTTGSSRWNSTASRGRTATSCRCSAPTRSTARPTGRSRAGASTRCSCSGTARGGGSPRPSGSRKIRLTRFLASFCRDLFSLQLLDLPPLALRRPPLSFIAQRRRDPELLGLPLPPPPPLGVLLVQLGGDGGRPAVLRDGAYHDQVLERAAPDPQAVADGERFRPLGVLAVDLDLPAADGGRRERPRLEKARGPQPAIEPDPSRLRHTPSSCKLHTGGRSCVYSVPTVVPDTRSPEPNARSDADSPARRPAEPRQVAGVPSGNARSHERRPARGVRYARRARGRGHRAGAERVLDAPPLPSARAPRRGARRRAAPARRGRAGGAAQSRRCDRHRAAEQRGDRRGVGRRAGRGGELRRGAGAILPLAHARRNGDRHQDRALRRPAGDEAAVYQSHAQPVVAAVRFRRAVGPGRRRGRRDSVAARIARAVRERPALAAARALGAAARARVRVPRSQAVPSRGGGAAPVETDVWSGRPFFRNSYAATLTVSFPLFSGG